MKFPCPLCSVPLEVLYSKKDKPYIQCHTDGMQMFIRYDSGIRRLEAQSQRRISQLDNFVICNDCNVGVRKMRKKIHEPFFGRAGLYCPGCDELLLEAPEDWKEKLKE